jgi:hypothetical protein
MDQRDDLDSAATAANWKVVSTADFNGDGKADLPGTTLQARPLYG